MTRQKYCYIPGCKCSQHLEQTAEAPKKLIVDPPSGWRYGFPKELKPGVNYEDLLRESGYPEKDIKFALTYSRSWHE